MPLPADRLKSAQTALAVFFFTQGFVAITFIPRIPEIIEQIGVSFAVWGLIIGFAGIGSLLPLLVANRLVGRFGTRPIINIASVFIVLSVMSLAWAPNGFVFFIFQTVMMFSMSFFNIAINAQSVMLQKRVKKVIIGKFHAAWSIGAGASAALSGIMASFVSLQIHLFVVPLVCLVVFQVYVRSMLSPEEDGHKEEKQASKKVPFLKSPNQLWLLALGLFTGVFLELVMMDWSALFSQQVMLLSPTLGAVPFASFMIAMIAGRLLITKATEKYHISELSKWGGIYGSIMMAVGLVVAPPLVEYNQILALAVLSFFWALGGFGLAPLVPSFFGAAGHVAGLTTSQALARMSLLNSLAVIGAKVVMGGLAETVGLQIAFVLPIILMFIAGILSGRLAKQAKRKEAVENAFPITGSLTVIDEL
jgi:predicted MFS family arabinose efflux permease